jgi:hypothetical protein
MKFYKYKFDLGYLNKIICNKLSAIYNYNNGYTEFYKKGGLHNYNNASYTHDTGYKAFHLNGIYYGNTSYFNKKSWRKFVKLQAFL